MVLVGTIGDVSGPPAELVFQELPWFVYADATHCGDCSRVDRSHVDPVIEGSARAPRFDISKTLDGAIIASDAFRDVCADVPGVTFAPVCLTGYWSVAIDQIAVIEPFESHVRTGPPCATCGRPRYVTRSGPLRLDPDEELPRGFSRTDVEFGDSADFGLNRPIRFGAHILVDRATARLLKSATLLGVHLITQP